MAILCNLVEGTVVTSMLNIWMKLYQNWAGFEEMLDLQFCHEIVIAKYYMNNINMLRAYRIESKVFLCQLTAKFVIC